VSRDALLMACNAAVAGFSRIAIGRLRGYIATGCGARVAGMRGGMWRDSCRSGAIPRAAAALAALAAQAAQGPE
jgi:hypothetical protein